MEITRAEGEVDDITSDMCKKNLPVYNCA